MDDFMIGQKVAIYWPRYGGGSYTESSIERDTKLYWVVDGRKFRKRDGVEPQARNTWDRPTRLLPLDDRRVVEAREKRRRDLAYGDVEAAHQKFNRNRENHDYIDALKRALDFYAEVLK